MPENVKRRSRGLRTVALLAIGLAVGALVLLYRAFVMVFPVITVPVDENGNHIKHDDRINVSNFSRAE